MSDFFSRPAPQQAVPGDLRGIRQAILDAILGGSGGDNGSFSAGLGRAGVPGQRSASGGSASAPGGVLGELLGFTSGQANTDLINSLRASADTRLNDQIDALNASSGSRFSSANLFTQGQLRERSQEDFNLLAGQILEQGQNRQLQSILALLGPILGPTFGGPFTQNPSGFENLLGGFQAAGSIANPFNTGGK